MTTDERMAFVILINVGFIVRALTPLEISS